MKSRDYRGGRICPGDRAIEGGEFVTINADGREGIVIDRKVMEDVDIVFRYLLWFDGGATEWVLPTDLTPVSNP